MSERLVPSLGCVVLSYNNTAGNNKTTSCPMSTRAGLSMRKVSGGYIDKEYETNVSKEKLGITPLKQRGAVRS